MNNSLSDIAKLIAPRKDFSCLIQPPLNIQEAWLGNLVAEDYPPEWQQRRRKARFEVLKEACEVNYVLAQSRGEELEEDEVFPKKNDARIDRPWIVTGHQPEFLHPGVWLKNYFTAKLSEQNDAYALNIIVEHDQIKHAEISYPQFDQATNRVVEKQHRFTQALATSNWEFALGKETKETLQFLDFMKQETAGYPTTSLLAELSIEQIDHNSWGTLTLAHWMVSIRKAAELSLGFSNHEVSTGPCCDIDSFLEFFLEIVVRHQEFFKIYNECLNGYRVENKLKNLAQPMPDLTNKDGWYELPFWLVHDKKKTREALFVKVEGDQFLIKGLSNDMIKFDMKHKTLVGLMVKFNSFLLPSGYRIRPRALTLTMFTRMFLADLFIHGLGGGKYDLITNEIVRKFYGLEPTPFSVVTGTCFLPFHKEEIKPVELLQNTRAKLLFDLRKMKLQPETCFEGASTNPELTSILQEIEALKQIMRDRHWGPRIHLSKQAREKTKNYYQQAYLKLKSLRMQLFPHVQGSIEDCQRRLNEFSQELKNQQLMRKREYPAFLYPKQTLREFFERAISST